VGYGLIPTTKQITATTKRRTARSIAPDWRPAKSDESALFISSLRQAHMQRPENAKQIPLMMYNNILRIPPAFEMALGVHLENLYLSQRSSTNQRYSIIKMQNNQSWLLLVDILWNFKPYGEDRLIKVF